ncbi:MAG: outer membrane protein assembly factor BamD [Myxococcota bacterium]
MIRELPTLQAKVMAEALTATAACYQEEGDSAVALRFIVKWNCNTRTPSAEIALYEMGQVAYTTGDLDKHGPRLKAMFSRYPQGLFQAEARFRRCGLDVAQKKYDVAVECLSSYRRLHPNTKRLAEALFCTRKFSRIFDKEYAQAADLFAQASAAARSDLRERAVYGRSTA